jgi:hypothetical protein
VDKVEYYEKVGLGVFVKTLISVLVFVFCVIGIIGGYSVSWLFGVVMIFPILFVVFIVYAIFGSLKITITSKELVVAFRFFSSKRLLLSDIESCEPIMSNARKYYGVGIRYGIDGSMAYSTSLGSAVKIIKVGERPFVFSTNHPETICQIISTKKQQILQ